MCVYIYIYFLALSTERVYLVFRSWSLILLPTNWNLSSLEKQLILRLGKHSCPNKLGIMIYDQKGSAQEK